MIYIDCDKCESLISYAKAPELLEHEGNKTFNGHRKAQRASAQRRLVQLRRTYWSAIFTLRFRKAKSAMEAIKKEEKIAKAHSAPRKTRYVECPMCDNPIFIR